MIGSFSLSGRAKYHPRKGSAKGTEDRWSLKVPLPLLFMLLMMLVIISVYDILRKSYDVHSEANRRVARAVLESTLTRANSGLNHIALRLAKEDRPLDAGLPEVVFRAGNTDVKDLASRTLLLGFDSDHRIVKGRIGQDLLGPANLTNLASQPAFPQLFKPHTVINRLPDTLLVMVNDVPFILSDPQPLGAAGQTDGPAFLVIGLPASAMVFDELQRYEVFGSGVLKSYLENQADLSGLVELIAKLQGKEYAQFHFSAVAQVSILLVAFVIAIMIGRHVDEKNDDLRQSRDTIAEREREAQHLRQLAEQASEAKSQFIHNMSHELRTPLHAVIGFAEVIKTQPFGPVGAPQYMDYINDIHSSGHHLLAIINDILDMSKIEAGKMTLNESVVDLGDVIGSCLRLVDNRAKNANVEISSDVSGDLPTLRGDERMIKQMLLNLLTNSVKFTPEGGQVAVHADVDPAGRVAVSVTDTGIGISPENMEKVMQAFGQVDASLERQYEGTGLGVPLVKAMAELHGASLELESTVDVGTTATIRFPADRIASRSEEMAA